MSLGLDGAKFTAITGKHVPVCQRLEIVVQVPFQTTPLSILTMINWSGSKPRT